MSKHYRLRLVADDVARGDAVFYLEPELVKFDGDLRPALDVLVATTPPDTNIPADSGFESRDLTERLRSGTCPIFLLRAAYCALEVLGVDDWRSGTWGCALIHYQSDAELIQHGQSNQLRVDLTLIPGGRVDVAGKDLWWKKSGAGQALIYRGDAELHWASRFGADRVLLRFTRELVGRENRARHRPAAPDCPE